MEHRIKYPFHRGERELYDPESDCPVKRQVWELGAIRETEMYGDVYGETTYYADGEGLMVLTEVSRHKPGSRYPMRVFYTRYFIDPDGKEFGHRKLRMATVPAFKRRCAGYAFPYAIDAVEVR